MAGRNSNRADRTRSNQAAASLLKDSITVRDYPTLQALLIMAAGVYVVVNLMVDLSYAVIDPRVRVR